MTEAIFAIGGILIQAGLYALGTGLALTLLALVVEVWLRFGP